MTGTTFDIRNYVSPETLNDPNVLSGYDIINRMCAFLSGVNFQSLLTENWLSLNQKFIDNVNAMPEGMLRNPPRVIEILRMLSNPLFAQLSYMTLQMASPSALAEIETLMGNLRNEGIFLPEILIEGVISPSRVDAANGLVANLPDFTYQQLYETKGSSVSMAQRDSVQFAFDNKILDNEPNGLCCENGTVCIKSIDLKTFCCLVDKECSLASNRCIY